MPTFRAVNVLDEQAWVEFDYGTDGLVTTVRWANQSPVPVRLTLTGKGGAVLGDVTLQPGQSGQRALVGAQRFPYDDDTGAYGIRVGF